MNRKDKELRIHFSPGYVELVEEEVCVSGRRVLVTGGTGLLGRAVCREFQNHGWGVLGTGYRRARPRLPRCDLLDEDAVRTLLQDYKPDVIVHCAAERRPDVVERHTEAAVNLNVHATGMLAKEAAGRGVCFIYMSTDYVFDGRNPPYGEDDAPNPLNQYGRSKLEGERETLRHCPAGRGVCFIYMSTDYVFDGRNPPYGEDDAPNPLNQYGRSKLEGERETLRHCPGAVVLRVPVLYGEVECVSESAVTALWTRVQEGATESCTLDHCQQRFPTDTRDVAAVCRKLAQRGIQDPSIHGIFHFSAKERMTKYEMAVAMATAFNLPSDHLIPLTEEPTGVLRPQNSQLECSRLELLGLSVEPRPFLSNITSCLWPFLPDKRWRQTVFH